MYLTKYFSFIYYYDIVINERDGYIMNELLDFITGYLNEKKISTEKTISILNDLKTDSIFIEKAVIYEEENIQMSTVTTKNVISMETEKNKFRDEQRLYNKDNSIRKTVPQKNRELIRRIKAIKDNESQIQDNLIQCSKQFVK